MILNRYIFTDHENLYTRNKNVDINTQSKSSLNGSYDFKHDFKPIHNYGSKDKITRIYKSETNYVDINTLNA